MTITKANNKKNLPSGTATKDSVRGKMKNPPRKTKPTKAKARQMEMEAFQINSSVQNAANTLDEVLLDVKLPEKSEELNVDKMETEMKEILDKMQNSQVKKMYTRYQNLWHKYIKEEGVSVENEYNDVKLVGFFQKISRKYAPSTLWVIYSCLNSYFINMKGENLKNLPRLTKYLKNVTHTYVSKKSKVFSPKQIHRVLIHCQDSQDPKETLMGVTVSLMYYGLLRCVDVLNVRMCDVEMTVSDSVEVSFKHARKRRNEGFTFYVPKIYSKLFIRYFKELRRSGAPKNDRFLKNYNTKAQTRTVYTGRNMVGSFVKAMCVICGIPNSEGYTTHALRRSAATNLADAGVSLVNLKRHGQWKSDSVAESYIANSEPLRKEREQMLMPAFLREGLKESASSSESDGSYDPPVLDLVRAQPKKNKVSENRTHPRHTTHTDPVPPGLEGLSRGPSVASRAPATPPAQRVYDLTSNRSPSNQRFYDLTRPTIQAPQLQPQRQVREVVYAIDGTRLEIDIPYAELESRERNTYNNCCFIMKGNEEKGKDI